MNKAGGWRPEAGGDWRLETGGWRPEAGGDWRLETGGWRPEAGGGWRPAAGGDWRLEAGGDWRLEAGGKRLQVAVRSLVAAAMVSCAIGCGGEEKLNPVPVDAVMDAGPGDGGDQDAAPPRRTVVERNPFGNVAEVDNLLWDGDFEWSSPFSDQYGWLSGPPLSFALSGVRVGIQCRSGIKCVAVGKGKELVAIGVSAKDASLDVSFWVKVSGETCDGMDARLFGLDSSVDPDSPIDPPTGAPDESGWCQYSAIVDARMTKTYLYIRNNTSGEVVVDDAVLKAVPKNMALKAQMRVPTAEEVAALDAAKEQLRKLQGPHDPPPNEAQRALERWKRR